MKKLVLVILGVFMFSGASYAQEFKPFKLGLGIGYANPVGEGAGAGLLVYGEPMYRISDEIAVGLRMETALVAKASINADGTFGSTSISGLGSYTLSGQYYLSNGDFRPFVGLGMGLYRVASIGIEGNGEDLAEAGFSWENKFGFYPRIGFDAGHFNMQLEYNFIGASDAVTFGDGEMKIKNSYIGFKLGFSILGGRY